METIKFRVEYEEPRIVHSAVCCPSCNKWFSTREILASDFKGYPLRTPADLEHVTYFCPLCNNEFGFVEGVNLAHAEECISEEDVYKGCLRKRVVWE